MYLHGSRKERVRPYELEVVREEIIRGRVVNW